MLKNKATKIVISLAGLLCMGSLFCGCGNTIGMATSTNSYNNEKVLAKDSSENSGNFPIHLSTGTSRIKIVGKKAQGTATLSLADNSDVQVEAVSYSK